MKRRKKMKKKILVLAMCLSVVGALTGCGKEKDKEKEQVDTGITTEAVINNDDTTAADTTTEAASDSEEEADGTGTCWIMEQDLSLPTVASPSDALTMEVKAYAIDSEDSVELPIKADYFNRFTYVGVNDVQYTSVEEALASDSCQKMVKPGDTSDKIGYGPTTEFYNDKYIPTYGHISVMNPTDVEVTYAQCVENGWFYVEDPYGSFLNQGNTDEIGDFNQDGDLDDKDTLDYYVSVWGAPTYFKAYNAESQEAYEASDTDEGTKWFIDNYREGGVFMTAVGWEFDEYVIVFMLSDTYYYESWNMEISNSIYYSRVLWDELGYYNGLPYLKEATGK